MGQQYTAAQLATLMAIFAKSGDSLIPGNWLTDLTVAYEKLDASLAELVDHGNEAFGWGDHALVGYLLAETDPFFSASPAAGIAAGDIDNWNDAYGWGDHALVGYLTSETDPVFAVHPASLVTAALMAQRSSAYTWGDHAAAGYAVSPAGIRTIAGHTTSGFVTGATLAEYEIEVKLTSDGLLHKLKVLAIDGGLA